MAFAPSMSIRSNSISRMRLGMMMLVGAALRLFFAGTTACSSEFLGFFVAVTMMEKRLSMTESAVTPYANWRGKALTCEAAMCSACRVRAR